MANDEKSAPGSGTAHFLSLSGAEMGTKVHGEKEGLRFEVDHDSVQHRYFLDKYHRIIPRDSILSFLSSQFK